MFRIDAAKHMDSIVDALEMSKSSPPNNQLNSPGLGPKAVDLWQINSEERFGRSFRKSNSEDTFGRYTRNTNKTHNL